ncbi:non-canonical purine NTP pyrophosphatase [Granulicella arctica]|uniref:non-canonical purine NTP pyrophosphatase n=1 Tax=Granulicella arctica TaxID=940613 RepID=UPI0021E0AB0B|nr:non-canonical purine NTP pyrophosphatase [Granulicella arctica]
MLLKLYVATSNTGKLRDFASASGPDVDLETLAGLATISAPPEDAPTFDGNARAKAIYYSLHAPGQIVIADDSGLEVDALDGAPGVRSARYADDMHYAAPEGLSVDGRNNACLLHALLRIPQGLRTGRYRCSLAAARDGQIVKVANGTVEGDILTEPSGKNGFGYDPLFYLSSYQKTMAELDPDARLACSHRGDALRRLLPLLRNNEGVSSTG